MGEKIKILCKKKLKKWTFEIFWTHFEVLYYKQSSEFVIPAFHDNLLGPKITKCGDPLYYQIDSKIIIVIAQNFLAYSKFTSAYSV